MKKYSEAYVGIDTAKAKHAVAIAEGGRRGEVRYVGEIGSSPPSVERTIARLAARSGKLHVCYEAGPTGYGLYRQVKELGHDCVVVAPSLIPKKPGDRVKTNRRDAESLARLLRAGELTAVWVPDPTHEAIRDLVRAREIANDDFRRKRQQLGSFLLRHGRTFSGRSLWSRAHFRWLAEQAFDHPALQIVFQDGLDAIEAAQDRLHHLDGQITQVAASWSLAPVVAAYQAMRGVSFLVAVIFLAEIGDVRRFENRRQLMSFLGLVPSERSTGESVRRGSLTLTGNRRARRALIESAWAYRFPARVSPTLHARLEGLPKSVRDIALKAQVRLCVRWQPSCGRSVRRSSRRHS